MQCYSLEILLERNKEFANKYSKNKLVKLVTGPLIALPEYQNKMLDYIQTLSNYFQQTIELRNIFTSSPRFLKMAKDHLIEEWGHNDMLAQARNHRPCIWDPIVESTSAWFAWKMLSLNDEEKTVLIHLVLETSANVFFQEAHKVLSRNNDTEYFKIHAEVDELHENMGNDLLSGLSAETYSRLFSIQEQGWDMMNACCNRIAELVFALDSCNVKENSNSLVNCV